MKPIKNLGKLLFSMFMMAFIFAVSGFSPTYGAVSGAVLSFAPNVIAVFNPDIAYDSMHYSSLNVTLFKELWMTNLVQGFFQDDSFLMDGEDVTQFVQYNKLNLALAGVDPDVVINRTTYPIPMSPTNETPGEILLNNYSTDSTLIQDKDIQTVNYEVIGTYNAKHKRALQNKYANHGLYSIAPFSNSTATPVINMTGPVVAGKKTLISKDISTLAQKFDEQSYPKTGRRLVMPSSIFWQFVETDQSLKNQAVLNSQIGTIDGVFVSYYGFKIYSREDTPYYNALTSEKLAYGAIVDPSDFRSCIAYIAKESFVVSRGSMKLFSKVDDPDYQGTIMNYLMYGFVGLKANRCVGAILQTA